MEPVLIVDNDPAWQDRIQQCLAGDGYDTIVASDGADALRVLETLEPSCVVLDLDRRIDDGQAILDDLRRRQTPPPVLVVCNDPSGLALGPADGVRGHVSKPFDGDDLALAVAIATQIQPAPSEPVNWETGLAGAN